MVIYGNPYDVVVPQYLYLIHGCSKIHLMHMYAYVRASVEIIHRKQVCASAIMLAETDLES